MSKSTRHLHILELEGSAAGGYAGQLFVHRGAKVIKLVSSKSPLNREAASQKDTRQRNLQATGYLDRGKERRTLHEEPHESQKELVECLDWADVLLESSAPEPLTPLSHASDFPNLIRVQISPFGSTGPYADFQSNAFTDDALGGHLYLNGEPSRAPLPRPGLQSHYQAGLHGFIGALSALRAREQSGKGQRVEVSHFEAMASLHQHTLTMWTHGRHILKREGNRQPGPWHPAGIYPCQDGYIMLVLSSSSHRDRFFVHADLPEILADPRFSDDLQIGQNKEAFDQALTPWLSNHTVSEIMAIAERSETPASPVNSLEDVLENPHLKERDYWQSVEGARVPKRAFSIQKKTQSKTTRSQAPLNSTRSSPNQNAAPLNGVRVLDLSRLWAGPLAGRILADLGADVIQIESPDARGGRITPPALGPISHLFPDDLVGEHPWNRIGSLNKLIRNKRSLTLDLKKEEAKELFERLVIEADVVLENFSPRVMPQLGLDFESLSQLNPKLIYTALSGYGNSGPHRDRVALGPVIEAESGASYDMRYSLKDSPYRSGVAWADPIAGLHAVAATLIALQDQTADSSPTARYVEVPMLESMISVMGEPLLEIQKRKDRPPSNEIKGAEPAPQGIYPCQGEDRWLALSIESNRQWRVLCGLCGFKEWETLSPKERHEKRSSIDLALSRWTQSQTSTELELQLQSQGIIAAAVRNSRDLIHDPQLAHGLFWARLRHPDSGVHTEPGCPIRLSRNPVDYRRPAPCLGEHNEEVLKEWLGAKTDLISELKEKEILVQKPS